MWGEVGGLSYYFEMLCRSPLTRKIYCKLNYSMRMISSTTQSTPTYWLPTLSNIIPPHLRREHAPTHDYRKMMDALSIMTATPPPT